MLGRGDTAEVFEYGNGKVCKLFFEGYPQKYIEHEYLNAKEVFRLKLKTPKPFGLITIDKRNGIVYERIDGESLLSYVQDTQQDELLDRFVQLHREWLSHHSDNVLSYKEYLAILIQSKDVENRKLLREIEALPDDDCILHGDFHPGNVLIKQSDGMPVIIDFMNVCHGPALYDIARTFFLLSQWNYSMANEYLKKMKVSKMDITKYVGVIEQCREYES